MKEVINMDSWHFWLYEQGMGYSISKWNSIHRVNRCKYLKEILRAILLIMCRVYGVILGIGVISLAPFVIFSWFMAKPTFMLGLTTVLVGVCLSIPVIAVKRKLWKQVGKVDTYISFKELALGCIKDIEKGLCPILTAKHLNR